MARITHQKHSKGFLPRNLAEDYCHVRTFLVDYVMNARVTHVLQKVFTSFINVWRLHVGLLGKAYNLCTHSILTDYLF